MNKSIFLIKALTIVACCMFLGGCIGLPNLGPLISGCVGECGPTMTTQSLITNSGISSGCTSATCNVQLEVMPGSSLCPNQSAKISVIANSQQIWNKDYFMDDGTGLAGAVIVGHVDLLSGGTVSAGDILKVTAETLMNNNQVTCKRQGNFVFEISLLN